MSNRGRRLQNVVECPAAGHKLAWVETRSKPGRVRVAAWEAVRDPRSNDRRIKVMHDFDTLDADDNYDGAPLVGSMVTTSCACGAFLVDLLAVARGDERAPVQVHI